MAGVFISYRREDSPGHAGRVFDRLRARLGSDVVFMDVNAIEAGVDFVEAIVRAVGSCDVLLAIIGPGWISAADKAGRRRLDDPHDFVRLEIAGALKRNVRVVPVLVDNADLPSQDDLPEELKPLTRRNAVELRDSRWDADIDQLVASLESIITPRAHVEAAPADASRPVASTGGRHRLWGTMAGAVVVVAAGAVFGSRACGTGLDESTRVAQTQGKASQSLDPQTQPSVSSGPEPPSGAAPSGTRGGTPGGAPVSGGAVATTPSARSRSGPARSTSTSPARRRGLGIGWFGLWLDTVTKNPPGVIVGGVPAAGPAADAGILVDDVLVGVAGRSVTSVSEVADAVADAVKGSPPGTTTIVEVVRNGRNLRLPVVLDRDFVLSR